MNIRNIRQRVLGNLYGCIRTNHHRHHQSKGSKSFILDWLKTTSHLVSRLKKGSCSMLFDQMESEEWIDGMGWIGYLLEPTLRAPDGANKHLERVRKNTWRNGNCCYRSWCRCHPLSELPPKRVLSSSFRLHVDIGKGASAAVQTSPINNHSLLSNR